MIYLFIALGIFLLDYNIKEYTDRHRLQGTRDEYFKGRLILQNHHNSEGGFRLFRHHQKLGERLSGVVLICVILEYLKTLITGGSALLKTALTFIAGGGLNNFYDRRVKGYVCDYFSLGVKNKKLRRLIFNLSDMFIFLGSFLYILGKLFPLGKSNTKRTNAQEES